MFGSYSVSLSIKMQLAYKIKTVHYFVSDPAGDQKIRHVLYYKIITTLDNQLFLPRLKFSTGRQWVFRMQTTGGWAV